MEVEELVGYYERYPCMLEGDWLETINGKVRCMGIRRLDVCCTESFRKMVVVVLLWTKILLLKRVIVGEILLNIIT